MAERDAAIKGKLASVKDLSPEVKRVEEQAPTVMCATRAEIRAVLKKDEEGDSRGGGDERRCLKGAARSRQSYALENLEKEETFLSLDSQISALSQEILKKVGIDGGEKWKSMSEKDKVLYVAEAKMKKVDYEKALEEFKQ